jgi:hypothetical protein
MNLFMHCGPLRGRKHTIKMCDDFTLRAIVQKLLIDHTTGICEALWAVGQDFVLRYGP